jgi:hypothetical protein
MWIKVAARPPIIERDAVVGLIIHTPKWRGGETRFRSADRWLAYRHLAGQSPGTGKKLPGNSDKQIALFAQFANTIRNNGSERRAQPGNTLLSYQGQALLSLVHPRQRQANYYRGCRSRRPFQEGRYVEGRIHVARMPAHEPPEVYPRSHLQNEASSA